MEPPVERMDISRLSLGRALALLGELQQHWRQQEDELCFFMVTLEEIDSFPIRMKHALRRFGVEDVGDLLKLDLKAFRYMDQIGQKAIQLILELFINMKRDQFLL